LHTFISTGGWSDIAMAGILNKVLMINKLKKYYNYIERFIKSPRKLSNFQQLLAEIKGKGLITGVRSVLHIKSGNYTPDFSSPFFNGGETLSKTYNRNETFALPNDAQPLVSIIIPTYNQLDYTYDCIRSISEHTVRTSYEVIVADDNSPDDSSVLSDKIKHLVLIRNSVNLGFLKNCNNAAASARGKYLVFVNNDTQVMKGWLEELLFVYRQFPDAGIVGSQLLYPNGALQEAGGIIWQDGSAINYGNRDNPAKPEYNYIREADYVSGASLMITKDLWQDIGGFDERYCPAYNEDSDLCFAARAKGKKVYYQPFSKVIHFEGMTHGSDTSTGVKKYQEVNKSKFAVKWQDELQKKAKRGRNVFTERGRTAGKKHVLIIDHNVPTVDKDAGSRTISNFIDSLLGLGYEVKFMVPNMFPTYDYMKQLQEKGVEVLHGEGFIFWRHEWEAWFKEHIHQFDALILSRSSICTPYIKTLKNLHYKGRTIYYGHDLGFLRTEQELELTGDAELKKVIKKTKADEDFMYQNVTDALVISYEEMSYLKNYITTPLHLIPAYFFDVKELTPGYDERNGILFVGGFHHPPNQDAMKWFLNNVYGTIEKQGINLTIAGSEMPDFLFEYKKKFPALVLLPDVPVAQLEELYAKTRIAIVPLQVGAGIKGKVIEAMAKGVPVVGTDRAFEGLLKDNSFLYAGCNDEAGLAAQIIRVYQDRQLWDQLSGFGKGYVARYFNKEAMKQVFNDILSR
jgi:GT2 family glycosyltransferase